jgi:hypothetical protein
MTKYNNTPTTGELEPAHLLEKNPDPRSSLAIVKQNATKAKTSVGKGATKRRRCWAVFGLIVIGIPPGGLLVSGAWIASQPSVSAMLPGLPAHVYETARVFAASLGGIPTASALAPIETTALPCLPAVHSVGGGDTEAADALSEVEATLSPLSIDCRPPETYRAVALVPRPLNPKRGTSALREASLIALPQPAPRLVDLSILAPPVQQPSRGITTAANPAPSVALKKNPPSAAPGKRLAALPMPVGAPRNGPHIDDAYRPTNRDIHTKLEVASVHPIVPGQTLGVASTQNDIARTPEQGLPTSTSATKRSSLTDPARPSPPGRQDRMNSNKAGRKGTTREPSQIVVFGTKLDSSRPDWVDDLYRHQL